MHSGRTAQSEAKDAEMRADPGQRSIASEQPREEHGRIDERLDRLEEILLKPTRQTRNRSQPATRDATKTPHDRPSCCTRARSGNQQPDTPPAGFLPRRGSPWRTAGLTRAGRPSGVQHRRGDTVAQLNPSAGEPPQRLLDRVMIDAEGPADRRDGDSERASRSPGRRSAGTRTQGHTNSDRIRTHTNSGHTARIRVDAHTVQAAATGGRKP